jgi:imidazolonepropionase-like amidohydrolase
MPVRASILLLLLSATTFAQDLGERAPPQKEATVILDATIHPVSGPAIERGWILFEKGRILELGPMPVSRKLKAPTRRIDGKGKHVYPGFVAAGTNLGLTEIGAVRATRDSEEVGEIKPEVRAVVAVNPDSTLLPVARRNGVLTAAVLPGGGVIAGRAGVIRLEGWTWEDLAVLDDAGLVVNWPGARPIRAWWMEESEREQRKKQERARRALREAFAKAAAYHAAKSAGSPHPVDVRWEAMASVLPLGGKPPARPVIVNADEVDQIRDAVRFAVERGLRPVIAGGRDASLCAPLLLRHDVPVIVRGVYDLPRRSDSAYDERFRLPARLEEAGVRWCLASGQPAANERNLPYAAAMAVAHGLPRAAAIRAITLSAAEILGVGARLGSLEPGKAATLIVTDGDPLEMTTTIEAAFLDGRELALEDKQTALYRKYRAKDDE